MRFKQQHRNVGAVLGVALLWLACQTAQGPQKSELAEAAQDPKSQRFATYCASCHGVKGDNFVNRVWKNGNTKEHIIRSIQMGSPEGGMPAFAEVLSATEIAELADFVLEASQQKGSESAKNGIFKSVGTTIKLDTIVSDADSPWGMVFLPNGDLLYTDRSGSVFLVNKKKIKTPVSGVPKVLYEGQGGLLDIVLHPNFAENKLIYLSYSKFKDSTGGRWSTTAVLQAKLEGAALSAQKDIFVAQPFAQTKHHYGGRLAFDKAGFLFITVGDRGNHFRFPQRLDNDCGKVHRLYDDGRVPTDNPFTTTDTARHSIWSYGHRNPQGLTIAADGTIWEHEHGPRGGDELNIILKGSNYGWPTISYGINYDGTVLTPLKEKEGMEQPQNYWIPSIAPCGMTLYTGSRYPVWKGNLLIGSLSFEYLNRCQMTDNKVTLQEKLLPKLGRVRCVSQDRDGYLYVAVEKKGYIFKLLPK